jgi:hypothetical protein
MEVSNSETTKLVVGFAIAFGSLLTCAVGILIGYYAIGKDTTVAVIGWGLAVFGLVEALFTRKIVELLFIIRKKKQDDPES